MSRDIYRVRESGDRMLRPSTLSPGSYEQPFCDLFVGSNEKPVERLRPFHEENRDDPCGSGRARSFKNLLFFNTLISYARRLHFSLSLVRYHSRYSTSSTLEYNISGGKEKTCDFYSQKSRHQERFARRFTPCLKHTVHSRRQSPPPTYEAALPASSVVSTNKACARCISMKEKRRSRKISVRYAKNDRSE